MKNFLFLAISLVSLSGVPAFSDDSEAPEAQLSAAGKRRLEENSQILSKNIQTATSNIENCQANVSTLEKQIAEVTKIELELNKLKEQYESFLKNADTESKKNREALGKLGRGQDRRVTSVEKTEREAWSKDTTEKMNKVKGLLQKLRKDSEAVQFQKRDLVAQKNHWAEREREHRKVLEELNSKQSAAEKKLRGDS